MALNFEWDANKAKSNLGKHGNSEGEGEREFLRLTQPPLQRAHAFSFLSATLHPYFPRLAGGTIPFMRRYSTICP